MSCGNTDLGYCHVVSVVFTVYIHNYHSHCNYRVDILRLWVTPLELLASTTATNTYQSLSDYVSLCPLLELGRDIYSIFFPPDAAAPAPAVALASAAAAATAASASAAMVAATTTNVAPNNDKRGLRHVLGPWCGYFIVLTYIY